VCVVCERGEDEGYQWFGLYAQAEFNGEGGGKREERKGRGREERGEEEGGKEGEEREKGKRRQERRREGEGGKVKEREAGRKRGTGRPLVKPASEG